MRDSKEYVPANLNPVFGKCVACVSRAHVARYFEFEACVPRDAEMHVSVWDYDTFTSVRTAHVMCLACIVFYSMFWYRFH